MLFPLKNTGVTICGLSNVIAVDPSLTNSGLCVIDNGRFLVGKLSPNKRGIDRLLWFEKTWRDILKGFPNFPVCIEGYAFGSKNQREAMGELGGVYRLGAYRAGHRVVCVPPTTVKKFTTGSGAAKKSMILKSVFKRWGLDLDDEDIADAVAVALFFAYGESCREGDFKDMTAAMREAVQSFIKKGQLDGEKLPALPRRERPAGTLHPVSISC